MELFWKAFTDASFWMWIIVTIGVVIVKGAKSVIEYLAEEIPEKKKEPEEE